MSTSTRSDWALRTATPEDVEPIAELRALVMRPDLERLGRYDEHRVRQRLRDVYAPEHTSVILVDGALAGCVTLRPVPDATTGGAADGWWLENFYLSPTLQGRGIGTGVLRSLLERADRERVTVRLDVLQGSAARALYERHGFVEERQDPIDVFMVREPTA
ncbi:GNAT family N-acetyltransferase [Streptomyces sp. NBC_01237]|uniref:GNAT family N-acetyltransferase n=1 Tax=Streptomyces sp. NBC_01237 TaxID=2903790 RepID=UPI002DD99443|nr:GNAT family N-acetyltransferase [Streptomyces sp. NBC_01237]WRZ74438.1 GNAT family N-acetyltransferase [Streptomyces sp. NBC_01237]